MPLLDRSQPDEFPFPVRVRRALARRFPTTRRLWNESAARLRGFLGLLRRRRPFGSLAWVRTTVQAQSARRREPRLTIAVDISAFWEPLTGVGWYLYRLLEHLADREDLRLRLYGPTAVHSPDLAGPTVDLPQGPALETISYQVPEDFFIPAGWIIRLLRRLEPLLLAADSNQVLFAPNYFLPRRFRLAGGARVTTVHDLGFRRFPWALRPETLQELAEKFEHSVRESSRVISVSHAVRDELAAYGYAKPSRVRVVHHGPGQLSTVEPGRVPTVAPVDYVLHVGTIEPRKNIGTLLEAFRLIRRQHLDCPDLVLCGRYGWKTDALQRQVETAQRQGWVYHLGYVDDPQLAALFRSARVVVFPSHYEGFGLPAVEAQWAGVPLVASDIPVLREVTGGAALLAAAEDPAAFANAIMQAASDEELRRDLILRGQENVRQLSWSRAADETATVWFEAAGTRTGG